MTSTPTYDIRCLSAVLLMLAAVGGQNCENLQVEIDQPGLTGGRQAYERLLISQSIGRTHK